jgi:hypothetical protein
MVTVTNPLGAITALAAFEGSFRWMQLAEAFPKLQVKVAYISKETGETLGGCDVQSGLLTPETVAAFQKAIQMAEEDFAKVIFGGSTREPLLGPDLSDTGGIETNTGLDGVRGLGQ